MVDGIFEELIIFIENRYMKEPKSLISNKFFVILIMLHFGFVTVYSQGSYDWREHNEAMENMEWESVFSGLLILLFIIGVIRMLSNRT